MATLYAENVPDDLYEALRRQARANRTSIAGEVLSLLEQFVPTKAVLARRAEALKFALQVQKRKPLGPGPFPSTEEMLREDRER